MAERDITEEIYARQRPEKGCWGDAAIGALAYYSPDGVVFLDREDCIDYCSAIMER